MHVARSVLVHPRINTRSQGLLSGPDILTMPSPEHLPSRVSRGIKRDLEPVQSFKQGFSAAGLVPGKAKVKGVKHVRVTVNIASKPKILPLQQAKSYRT